MEKLIKTIGLFIGIGILNTIAFTFYLSTTGLPGGEVGMAPFLIAMESGIAIVLSTVIYLLVRNRFKVTTIRIILIYQVIYLLTLIFSGVNPFDGDLTATFKTLAQWTYFVSFLVTIALLLTAKLISGLMTNRE
ncbi:MAG: hypothetical protein KF845_13360 [Cyclobacteriaceae bacterium]|nr:hypothetical protein [Cyclobacteriaceae bacterium]